jgi:putative endopeptidase
MSTPGFLAAGSRSLFIGHSQSAKRALATAALTLAFLGCLGWGQTKAHSGFDLSQLDRSADPCVDFYQFACGGWRAKNPLPPDRAVYNRYAEMNEINLAKLRSLFEAAAQSDAKQDRVPQEVGGYYAACIDEAAAERKKAEPIASYLARIAALKDKRAMLALTAELDDLGMPMIFDFNATPDHHNSSMTIAEVNQGGLSLPDRDYYLKTDAKTVEQRQEFIKHVTKMFSLAGLPESQAKSDAETVLRLETELARASLDRTARRDPANLDHKMSVADFNALAPNFYFADFVKAAKTPAFDSLNVTTPEFFRGVSTVIETASLDDWKIYLRWRVLRVMSTMLSADFVNEYYRFNNQYLRGTKTLPERWKRCVFSVDQQLGEASGQLFVDKYFGAQGRQKVREIVDNVMEQLSLSIAASDWMSDATKQKALLKLKKISTSKLGFPDHYRDYSSIDIKRDDYVGNYLRTSHFESKRQKDKIGTAVDKSEWDMTPPTVNAYYSPEISEIVLPAGILQPPMFDLTADEAYSYGAIGRVIGHELTHGFDDEGRKYDADGNLTDWWTAQDAKAFEERASCIDKQYSQYSPVDDGNGKLLYLNGKLTLGENVADNGGLRMAYRAYMKAHPGEEGQTIDGFTAAQRVFLGYAISRCENVAPDMSRVLIRTDPHSPGKFRLIGATVNMTEFQAAFSCKTGQPMAPENRCRVW